MNIFALPAMRVNRLVIFSDRLQRFLDGQIRFQFLVITSYSIHYTKLYDILKIFSQWGFRPVIPPSLEFLHDLERGLGAGLREKTFRFDDRQSGKLVAFPPDITPQVARIVATRMREMPLPLRLCYSGRVLRHTEMQAGKDREIFQAGVELIGLDT